MIGDFLPALSGLALGGVLLLDFFKERGEDGSEIVSISSEKFEAILLKNKKYIGIAGILTAILHFLMPNIPII